MFRTKVVEKLATHIFGSIMFFLSGAVYKVMWKNIVERGRPQMTIWRMCIACWILKTTNIQTVCVILIVFPLYQWLRESYT